MQSGIYKIENIKNGKVYIGSSITLRKRQQEHVASLNRQRHHNFYLLSDWMKMGCISFTFTTLEYCKKEDLVEREQHYIDLYMATNSTYGYNICPTARSVLKRPCSSKTKLKLSLSNRIPHIFKNNQELKTCGRCKKDLPLSNYSFSSYSWDGLLHKCRLCNQKNTLTYKTGPPLIRDTEGIKKRKSLRGIPKGTHLPHKIEDNIEKKYCGGCDAYKNLTAFSKNKKRWDELSCKCKECYSKYHNLYLKRKRGVIK